MDKCYVWKGFFINHITDVEDLEYICIGEGGGRGATRCKKIVGDSSCRNNYIPHLKDKYSLLYRTHPNNYWFVL